MKKRIACLLLALLLLAAGCTAQKPAPTTTTDLPEESGTSETTTHPLPDPSPYEGLDDKEKLIAVNTWEKEGNPKNVMVFEAGGKGLITNSGISYRMTWTLEGSTLTTEVTLIQGQLTQTVVYDLKMESGSYFITNRETNTGARFFISGTQSAELPPGGQKDPAVIGKWAPEDSSYFGYLFADDNGRSGKFSVNDETQAIRSGLRWTVYEYEIYIYLDNGQQYVYEYMVSGSTLTLYRPGEPDIVYKRVP